jgi:hypothetical protein
VPFSCDRSIEDVRSLIMITPHGIMPSEPFCMFSPSYIHRLEKPESYHARPFPFLWIRRSMVSCLDERIDGKPEEIDKPGTI